MDDIPDEERLEEKVLRVDIEGREKEVQNEDEDQHIGGKDSVKIQGKQDIGSIAKLPLQFEGL